MVMFSASFYLIALLSGSTYVQSRAEDVSGDDGVSLLKVYGALRPVDKLLPWSQRKSSAKMLKRVFSDDDDVEAKSPVADSDSTSPAALNFTLSLPSLTVPSLPTITMPSIPTLTIPSLPSLPTLTIPSLTAPSFTAPSFPSITVPTISAPTISAPTLTLPSISVPTLTFPSLPTLSIPTLTPFSTSQTSFSTSGEKCGLTIEIVLFQDISFGNSAMIDKLNAEVLAEVELSLKNFFVDVRIALVSFSDLYLASSADARDYCAQVNSALSSDFTGVAGVLGNLTTTSRVNLFANQLGAVIAGVESSQTGWSRNSNTIRLALMLTGSNPHFALDGLNLLGLPAFRDEVAVQQLEQSCAKQYYPSPEQVAEAIFSQSVYLGFVLPASLLQIYVQSNYLWLSSYLNQTAAFVQVLDPEFASFSAKIMAIVQEIASVECIPVATSTPTPSTWTSTPPTPAPTVLPSTIATTMTTATTNTVASTTTVPSTTWTATTEPSTAAPTEIASTTYESTSVPTTVLSTSTAHEITCTTSDSGSCDPDEVVIKLREVPKRLHLEINND